ncbi:MAG: LamG-like jellyroll fold domain-containing protein [Sedimentisphaerales bacterium]|jgi:type II secretory pathway pseudopilin PulG
MRVKKHSIICRSRKAITLIELIVAMTLMAIIFTAMVPQFHAIRTSWANNEVSSTLIQNGMVLDEHINRNLSAMAQLISVSPSSATKGYIIYKDTAGNQKRYMVSDGNVVFGDLGSEEPLAGPVSRFQVSSYSLNNFTSPTTDANTIRFIQIQTTFINSAKNETFTTSVYLPANSSGVAGCWKLDETSGIIAKDSSGNGNDGTLQGTPLPTWGVGQINGGLVLNGTSDYVYLGTDSSLNFGDSKPFTITAWINTTKEYGLIVSLRNPDSDGSDIDFAVGSEGGDDDPGKAMILVRQDSGGEWASVTSINKVNDGTWHHVAAVRTGNTVELFVDGNSQGKNSGAEAGGAITTNVRAIGYEVYWGDDDSYFAGTIDDVRIYNLALKAAEIKQLVNVLRYRVFTEAKTLTP